MSVSDNFNRADAATLGANWTNDQGSGFGISSNQAQPKTAANYGSAFWSANSFNNDHSSEFTCASANLYPAVGVRMSSGSNWYAYFAHREVQKAVGGSVTLMGTFTNTFGSGDVAKLTATGTTLEGFKNGASQGTLTDASLSTGAPGLVAYDNATLMDDWTGTGEISGPGVSRILKPNILRPAIFCPGIGR